MGGGGGDDDGGGGTMSSPSFSSLNLPALPSSFLRSSGRETPPLHTSASVPFRWEEQPGKPRPCTDIIPLPPEPELELELPPSRMITKLPSPTTVLDWPDNAGRPRFSSFRFFSSVDGGSSSGSGGSPGSVVDNLLLGRKKRKGLFGRATRSQSVRKEAGADGGSFGISLFSTTTCEKCKKVEEKMTRNGSISRLTQATDLWVSLRESLRQAMPWKISSRKSRNLKRLGRD